MREIIKSLVLFVEEDQTSPLLENAEKQFGHQNLRLFSDEILKWLRSDLFVPRNKVIRYDNRPGWFSDFSLFVKNLDELNELFRCGKYSVDFREEISFAERVEIHQYVAENYKPHLFITYR